MKTISKKLIISLIAVAGLSVVNFANAQTDTTLIVNGVCEMCRMTIEKAADMDGVSKAEWNVESKVLTVSYDPQLTSLEAISVAINDSGYDTEINTASEEAYQKLHKCCHYRDPEVVKQH